jgi:hypothetical protein
MKGCDVVKRHNISQKVTLGFHIKAREHNQRNTNKTKESKRWSSKARHTRGVHLKLRQGGTTKGESLCDEITSLGSSNM